MWFLIPIIFLVIVLTGMVHLLGFVFSGSITWWPWLLVGAGLWLIFKDKSPRRRHYWAYGNGHGHGSWGGFGCDEPRQRSKRERQEEAKRDSVAAATVTAPAPAAVAVAEPPKAKLPIDLEIKVEQIRRKADVLQGFANRFPPFSHDLYLVKQTASEYLPRTVGAYTALTEDAVDRVVDLTGKTPREELREQLDLLDKKLDEIAVDLQKQDVDRLLANRRFLEERFGKEEGVRPEETTS
jgi:hypothetical protein